MASTTPASTSPDTNPSLGTNAPSAIPTNRVSCLSCRRRKVKCDRISPCAHCAKSQILCEYVPRKRAPRRPMHGLDSKREAELLSRLNKLEGTVKALRGHVDTPHIPHISTTVSKDAGVDGNTSNRSLFGRAVIEHTVTDTSTSGDATRVEESFGTLVLSDGGTTRYLNRSYWSRLREEVDDIRNLVADDISDDDSLSPETTSDLTQNDTLSFVFGYGSSNVNLETLHPLPSQLQYYLKAFMKNVDPLHKVLHIPTVEVLMRKAENGFDTLTSSEEALLFAIYFAVIVSEAPQDAKFNFGLDKQILLDRHCFGVEQALARADFLNTNELVTLQAFFIYLACARCLDNPRAGWTLTRPAIRVAQGQGLHRDGTQLGMPPFEAEMRRRLWWQLCILELRDSERNGTDASIVQGSFDTKVPLNINDSDILPGSIELPQPRQGLTEMTVSLLVCDVCSTLLAVQFSRPRLGPYVSPSPAMTIPEMERIIQDFQEMLPEKYLKYCTDDSPIAWVTANMCMLITFKMQLMAFLPLAQSKPRESIPKETSDRMWFASIKTVEYRRNLEVESTKHWHWYLRMFVQWHAIAYLLGELCIREPDESVAYAWKVLDSVFMNWVEKQKHGAPEVLWAPMRKLITMARRKRKLDLEKAREAESERESSYIGETYTAFSIPADIPPTYPSHGSERKPSFVEQQATLLDSDLYQSDWLQQAQGIPDLNETPWLLEDSALVDLGIDMGGIDGEMEWEGMNDWIQEFQVEGTASRN